MSRGIPGRATGVVNSDIARLHRDNDLQERTAAMPADAAAERSGRLSKSHLKYPYTYTFDEALPGRVPSSSDPVARYALGLRIFSPLDEPPPRSRG